MDKKLTEVKNACKNFFRNKAGFKIKGDKITYQKENILLLFEPCLSRFNTPAHISFWFNLSGYLVQDQQTAKVKADDRGLILFSERWSFLWGSIFFQYEYPVQSEKEITDDILERCFKYLLPFCNNSGSLYALIEQLVYYQEMNNTRKFNFNIAVALTLSGQKNRSRDFFKDAEGDPELIKKIAKEQYGIDIDQA